MFWIFWRHSWLIYRVHSIHDMCDVIHGFFCKAIIVWATCINVIWACSDNIYRTCEMTHFTNPYRNRTSIALFIEVYVWLMKIFVSDPQRYYGIITNYLFTFLSSRWLSPVTLVSSTNKTDRHDITEILLKVALNTITLTLLSSMTPLSITPWTISEMTRKENIKVPLYNFAK